MGAGTINVSNVIGEANRDLSALASEEKTIQTSQLDFYLSVDNRWASMEGREAMANDTLKVAKAGVIAGASTITFVLGGNIFKSGDTLNKIDVFYNIKILNI